MMDTVQFAAQDGRKRGCQGQTGSQGDCERSDKPRDDVAHHAGRRGSKSDPDANFSGSLRHVIGHDSVKADDRKQQSQDAHGSNDACNFYRITHLLFERLFQRIGNRAKLRIDITCDLERQRSQLLCKSLKQISRLA